MQDALHVCSNRLLDVLLEVGYEGPGRKTEVPPAVYLPLFDLGVHHLRQIVQKNGNQTLIVPASHLQTQLELQGLKAKVSKTQRVALNTLTLLITSDENECALDPAKYGRAGDLPAPSRVIKKTPPVLQLLRHRSRPECRRPKQRQILEAFLSSGPSTEKLRTAAENGKAPVLTNKRKSRDLPRASPFEVRKELPHFQQLIEALLLRDRQAADQDEKSGRKLRPRHSSGRGNTGDSNLQKLVRQLPMCSTEAGYVTFLREQCSQPEVVALLYDDHYQILGLLLERWVEDSQQYLVKWQPHKVRNEHLAILSGGLRG